MGNAKATVSIFNFPQGIDNTQQNQIVRGLIAITGALDADTYPTGGFPLSWALEQIKSPWAVNAINASGATIVRLPTQVLAWSAAASPSGYIYLWDRVAGKLHIMVASSSATGSPPQEPGPLAEYSGTVTNDMLNDTIQYEAVFPFADI